MSPEFAAQLAHSTQQAMTAGWWAYAQTSVRSISTDKCHHGMYSDLLTRVAASVRSEGYRPAPHELKELP